VKKNPSLVLSSELFVAEGRIALCIQESER